MRYTIWEKDDFFPAASGRIDMDPAVVRLPEKRIALSWLYDWTKIVGLVTDVRLEDGEISGEVEWIGPYMDYEIYENFNKNGATVRIGGYYKDVFFTDSAKTRVKSCTLVATAVILIEANPGAKL